MFQRSLFAESGINEFANRLVFVRNAGKDPGSFHPTGSSLPVSAEPSLITRGRSGLQISFAPISRPTDSFVCRLMKPSENFKCVHRNELLVLSDACHLDLLSGNNLGTPFAAVQ